MNGLGCGDDLVDRGLKRLFLSNDERSLFVFGFRLV